MEDLDDLDDLTCKDCHKQFKHNSVYQRHINKKIPCKPIDENDDIETIKRKHTNLIHKIINKTKKS